MREPIENRWSLESEDSNPSRPEGEIRLHEGSFVLVTAYTPDLVERLRALPDRWYDPGRKQWLVPPVPRACQALLAVVRDYGFTPVGNALDEVERIGSLHAQIQTDPLLRSVERYLFRAPDFETLMVFPRNHTVGEEIKSVLGAVWDKRVKAFRIEATAQNADAILNVAGEYNFYVEPAEYERIATMGFSLFDDDDDFRYDGLASSDRILYRMLIRYSVSRRENLFDAVRNYRYL
jgi:hypothetical protein